MKLVAKQMNIGAIVYPNMDQMDLTGPFEVLARIPNSTFCLISNLKTPISDAHGFVVTPDKTLTDSPPLDLLVVPGGPGQEALMDDEMILTFLKEKAASAKYMLSVCTGALLCGAAGLLRGVRATTHWSVFHLLGYFGAVPVRERVVIDGRYVSTAGVTAGIDGALRLVSLLTDDHVAQRIQLAIEYDPSPPFMTGSSRFAPADLVDEARDSVRAITNARHKTARRIALDLGYTRF